MNVEMGQVQNRVVEAGHVDPLFVRKPWNDCSSTKTTITTVIADFMAFSIPDLFYLYGARHMRINVVYPTFFTTICQEPNPPTVI